MRTFAVIAAFSAAAALPSAFACEVSDQIGSEACPLGVALSQYDADQDNAVSADELVAAAADQRLSSSAAANGMTNRVAEIIVRMVDANSDNEVTAAELQAYVAKQG